MPIHFSAVAKGGLILSKFAIGYGNYNDIIQQVLPKISLQDKIRTYSIGEYLFNYIEGNKLLYFCITDKKYPIPKTFSFLQSVREKFLATFQGIPPDAIPFAAVNEQKNGAFDKVIQAEMTRYNDRKTSMTRAKAELDGLKTQMLKTVNEAARRGERLDVLINRTDMVSMNSSTFRSTAVQVQRKYWWQNMKMKIIIVLVLVLVVYGGVTGACGGFKWPKCV